MNTLNLTPLPKKDIEEIHRLLLSLDENVRVVLDDIKNLGVVDLKKQIENFQ